MLDFEQYVVFTQETRSSWGLSLVAVLFVIIFITASFCVTIMVTISVLLVDLFLVALVYYWGLTFNGMIVVNVVVAIGLAVEYSTHIAYTYLTIEPSSKCKTESEKRVYKAKKAVSQMGSSVFHGGFSTFLAVAVLGVSKSYVFVVFFKLWMGIIIFGMANGFFLLPVIFSFIGPTETHDGEGNETSAVEEEKDEDDEKGKDMDNEEGKDMDNEQGKDEDAK